MATTREWEIEELKGKYGELKSEHDGLERLLQECEATKQSIIQKKAECWDKLQSIKNVLYEKYGVVVNG